MKREGKVDFIVHIYRSRTVHIFFKFSSKVLFGRIYGIRALTKHSLLCWP